MTHRFASSGFTLVETLIATGLVVTAIAGLAQLFALSVRFTRDAGQFGLALVAAQDKLETLRSMSYTYDAAGAAITDGRLLPSPSTSLAENISGYVDWLDQAGGVVAARGAVHVRRWRISEIAFDDPAAIAIDVCVFDAAGLNRSPIQAEACLSAVRVRQP
jgi:type II secretory pathway pseudopilin PulG